jgi:pSer/pThr/pTyr-binding forkhead associated (FHA) protein
MRCWPSKLSRLLLAAALTALALIPLAATAQSEAAVVRITHFEAGAFPSMVARFIAADAENRPLLSPEVGLLEDGRAVENVVAEVVTIGVDLTLVIDANEELERIDEIGGQTRREKVRDAIIRFAERYMDPVQRDRVSIIVPDGNEARFVEVPDLVFNTEVINAINFYQPPELRPNALEAMLVKALEHAAAQEDPGRFQAIVLFSDGAGLAEDLPLDELADQARQLGVVFYGAILGARADTSEIENMNRLTLPTLGRQIHMPQAERADLLYEVIRGFGEQTVLRFRSSLNGGGEHQVVVRVGQAEDTYSFALDVQPAGVRLAIDNTRPIMRVAPDPETELHEMEPTRQLLVAEITWPDGYPRLLDQATLFVNDLETPLAPPVLDTEGRLTFEWDISGLDEGVYSLRMLVVDELGLAAASDALPLTIAVQRPATPEPSPEPTSPPPPAVEPTRPDLSSLFLAGIVLIVFVVAAVIALWLMLRRPRKPAGALPEATERVSLPEMPYADPEADALSTMIMPPAFAIDDTVGAYLEPLENASEHRTQIPLTGKNVALGRDARLVQIPFQDRSVSRLHARIIASHGAFRIYDEGSSSGTYVNYKRVALTPVVLRDQDHIHLGRVHMRFRLTLAGSARGQGSATGDDHSPPTEIYGQE